MDEVRIPINVEIMPAALPANSLSNASSSLNTPVHKMTMSFKLSDKLRDVWTRIESHYNEGYSTKGRDDSFFTVMQSRSNGDLPLDEVVGWHFNASMSDEQRVLRMKRNRIDRECSLPVGTIFQPEGHKRKRLEDLDPEQREIFKKRKYDEIRCSPQVVIFNADAPVPSRESASTSAAPPKHRDEDVPRIDHEGFAVPRIPDRRRSTQDPRSSQSSILVPNSQAQMQPNPTSDSAPVVIADDTPAEGASRDAFQVLTQRPPSSRPTANAVSRTKWTKNEDENLMAGKAKKWSISKIIQYYNLQRSESACRNRSIELAKHDSEQRNSQLQVESVVPSSSQQQTDGQGPTPQTQNSTQPSSSVPRAAADQSTPLASSNAQPNGNQHQLVTPISSTPVQVNAQSTPITVTAHQSGPQVPSTIKKKMNQPEVQFDWPSPPWEKRPVNQKGEINAGSEEFPWWMKLDHPWLQTEDAMWARAVKKAKPEWIKHLFNEYKAANVHLVYMSSGDTEACKRLSRSLRLARAERRRKMGLPRLQDMRQSRLWIAGMPEEDRDWPDVSDSQYDPEEWDDDLVDWFKMFKKHADATNEELRLMIRKAYEDGGSEDDEDDALYSDGVDYDRHVSEVSDNDEEELDDYDKERRILEVPGFTNADETGADNNVDSLMTPRAQRALRRKRNAESFHPKLRSLVQSPDLDVYDADRNFLETTDRSVRSISPSVQANRLVRRSTNFANAMPVEDPVEDATELSDATAVTRIVTRLVRRSTNFANAKLVRDPIEDDAGPNEATAVTHTANRLIRRSTSFANAKLPQDPIEDGAGPSDATGATDAEVLQGFVDIGEFDDYEEDAQFGSMEVEPSSDAPPAIPHENEPDDANPVEKPAKKTRASQKKRADIFDFNEVDEDKDEDEEFHDAKAEPSSDDPLAIPNLDGANDAFPIGKPEPKVKSKPKKKFKPGFGYVERTEEELEAARKAQPSPGTISGYTKIDVPRNPIFRSEDTEASPVAHTEDEEDLTTTQRRRKNRRQRKKQRRSTENEKLKSNEPEALSKRTTVSITGSPQAKGSTNDPTPTKIAAEDKENLVQSATAYYTNASNRPPRQPNFRPKPAPLPSRPAAPAARSLSQVTESRPATSIWGCELLPGQEERLRILREMPLPAGPRPKSPPPKLPYPSDDDSWSSSSSDE